jgi:hypothetical protein
MGPMHQFCWAQKREACFAPAYFLSSSTWPVSYGTQLGHAHRARGG